MSRGDGDGWTSVRRARRLLLGDVTQSVPKAKESESPTLHTCFLRPEAICDGLHLLQNKSAWRGGVLIGQRQVGELHVCALRPNGPRVPRNTLFTLDASYQLGLSDMLPTAELDWQGQWVIAPDNGLPDGETREWVAGRGKRLGLIDDDHPILFLAADRHGLAGCPLLWEPEEELWRELKFHS